MATRKSFSSILFITKRPLNQRPFVSITNICLSQDLSSANTNSTDMFQISNFLPLNAKQPDSALLIGYQNAFILQQNEIARETARFPMPMKLQRSVSLYII